MNVQTWDAAAPPGAPSPASPAAQGQGQGHGWGPPPGVPLHVLQQPGLLPTPPPPLQALPPAYMVAGGQPARGGSKRKAPDSDGPRRKAARQGGDSAAASLGAARSPTLSGLTPGLAANGGLLAGVPVGPGGTMAGALGHGLGLGLLPPGMYDGGGGGGGLSGGGGGGIGGGVIGLPQNPVYFEGQPMLQAGLTGPAYVEAQYPGPLYGVPQGQMLGAPPAVMPAYPGFPAGVGVASPGYPTQPVMRPGLQPLLQDAVFPQGSFPVDTPLYPGSMWPLPLHPAAVAVTQDMTRPIPRYLAASPRAGDPMSLLSEPRLLLPDRRFSLAPRGEEGRARPGREAGTGRGVEDGVQLAHSARVPAGLQFLAPDAAGADRQAVAGRRSRVPSPAIRGQQATGVPSPVSRGQGSGLPSPAGPGQGAGVPSPATVHWTGPPGRGGGAGHELLQQPGVDSQVEALRAAPLQKDVLDVPLSHGVHLYSSGGSSFPSLYPTAGTRASPGEATLLPGPGDKGDNKALGPCSPDPDSAGLLAPSPRAARPEARSARGASFQVPSPQTHGLTSPASHRPPVPSPQEARLAPESAVDVLYSGPSPRGPGQESGEDRGDRFPVPSPKQPAPSPGHRPTSHAPSPHSAERVHVHVPQDIRLPAPSPQGHIHDPQDSWKASADPGAGATTNTLQNQAPASTENGYHYPSLAGGDQDYPPLSAPPVKPLTGQGKQLSDGHNAATLAEQAGYPALSQNGDLLIPGTTAPHQSQWYQTSFPPQFPYPQLPWGQGHDVSPNHLT